MSVAPAYGYAGTSAYSKKFALLTGTLRQGGGFGGIDGNPLGVLNKKSIPKVPPTNNLVRFHPAPGEEKIFLAYLALAISLTDSEWVIQTAMASAGGYLVNVPKSAASMGMQQPSTQMKLLDANGQIQTETVREGDTDAVYIKRPNGKFPLVTPDDIQMLRRAEDIEIGALFGIFFYAIGKQVNGSDTRSFNQSRRKAVLALIKSDPVIFVDDSAFITPEVLIAIHKAYSVLLSVRYHTLKPIIENLDQATTAAGIVFKRIFNLNAGNGISIIYMANKTLEYFPHFPDLFPELGAEIMELYQGMRRIIQLSIELREYGKYIYGSDWVPIDPQKTKNLLAVLRITSSALDPTYEGFGGPGAIGPLKAKAEELIREWKPEITGEDFQTQPTGLDDEDKQSRS